MDIFTLNAMMVRLWFCGIAPAHCILSEYLRTVRGGK
jgi:hypothetical protein